MTPKGYLSSAQVAELLQRSPHTIRSLAWKRVLPYTLIGRVRFFKEKDVRALKKKMVSGEHRPGRPFKDKGA